MIKILRDLWLLQKIHTYTQDWDEEIQKKELKRKYMCIVCGDVERDGTVDAPIRRADGSVINRIVARTDREP